MLKRIFAHRTRPQSKVPPTPSETAQRSAEAAPVSVPVESVPADTFARTGHAAVGTRALAREFRAVAKAIDGGSLCGYSHLECKNDNLHQWSVRLHLDSGTLAEDLRVYARKHGQNYLQLRVQFPDDFFQAPPMVWVKSPILKYRTGFVSRGAVCSEMLISTGGINGWQPSYKMEGVLTTIRANFQDPAASGRIENLAQPSSYTLAQATAGLERARIQHTDGVFKESAAISKIGATSSTATEPTRGVIAFPERLADLSLEQSLRGVTSPNLMRSASGQRFVAKRNPPSLSGLVQNEFSVLKAYEALGVAVPPAKMYTTPEGPVLLSAFIQGTELGVLTGTARASAEARVRQSFVVDALLGAWDMVGATGDNVIVDKDGEAWRIDNGCGYDRRARGGTKTAEQFGKSVGELDSLRQVRDRFSIKRHDILRTVTDADIRRQRDGIKDKAEALFAVVPPRHLKTMRDRWDALMRW